MSALDRLKEYKELIGIMVFFLGGFFWLNTQFNQFPKKDDLKAEVDYLNCKLEKYMMLTQLQIRHQELEKSFQDLSKKISIMPSESTLSPAMRIEYDDIKSSYSYIINELRQNETQMKNLIDELARDVCGKR